MGTQDDDARGGYTVGDGALRRNGSSPDERDELPLDFAAVQADDALIDALAGAGAAPRGSDAQLTQVLLAWRDEIDRDLDVDEPLVDVDSALATVARAQRPARRRPVLMPVAAAAAMAVIAFSGLGLGAKAAEPGDRLWSLTKVLYSEHARSVEAAVQVRTQLDDASNALQAGRPAEAQDALTRAQQELPAVNEEEGRGALAARHGALLNQLTARSSDGEAKPPTANTRTSTARPPQQQSGAGAGAGAGSGGSDDGGEEPPAEVDDPPAQDVSTPPPSAEPPTPTPSPAPEQPEPGTGAGGSKGGSDEPTPRSAPAEGDSPVPPVTEPTG